MRATQTRVGPPLMASCSAPPPLPPSLPRLQGHDITRERERTNEEERRGEEEEGGGARVCARLAFLIEQTAMAHTHMRMHPSQHKQNSRQKQHTHTYTTHTQSPLNTRTQSSQHRNDMNPIELKSQVARESREEKEVGLLNPARTCTQGGPLARRRCVAGGNRPP